MEEERAFVSSESAKSARKLIFNISCNALRSFKDDLPVAGPSASLPGFAFRCWTANDHDLVHLFGSIVQGKTAKHFQLLCLIQSGAKSALRLRDKAAETRR